MESCKHEQYKADVAQLYITGGPRRPAVVEQSQPGHY